jgi:hypothetical protein
MKTAVFRIELSQFLGHFVQFAVFTILHTIESNYRPLQWNAQSEYFRNVDIWCERTITAVQKCSDAYNKTFTAYKILGFDTACSNMRQILNLLHSFYTAALRLLFALLFVLSTVYMAFAYL